MKKESITRISLEDVKNLKDLSDWDRVKTMSDDEALQNALDDPDNQPISFPPSKDLKPFKRLKK